MIEFLPEMLFYDIVFEIIVFEIIIITIIVKIIIIFAISGKLFLFLRQISMLWEKKPIRLS